jgi:hypothetical protein
MAKWREAGVRRGERSEVREGGRGEGRLLRIISSDGVRLSGRQSVRVRQPVNSAGIPAAWKRRTVA